MRSVNTSLVVVLPILSLLLFGGETLKDFAFAMLIGVITGAYSSIFVAVPILVVLKEREPRYQQLRARLEAKPGERRLRTVPSTATAASAEVDEATPAAVGARPASAARSGGSAHQRARNRKRNHPPSASGGDRMNVDQLKALVRDVPDFPQPGIVFKDITPLLADELAFSTVIDLIVVQFGRGNVDKVVGIEARGFILASPVAYHFGAGFVPVRKKDKLPWDDGGGRILARVRDRHPRGPQGRGLAGGAGPRSWTTSSRPAARRGRPPSSWSGSGARSWGSPA